MSTPHHIRVVAPVGDSTLLIDPTEETVTVSRMRVGGTVEQIWSATPSATVGLVLELVRAAEMSTPGAAAVAGAQLCGPGGILERIATTPAEIRTRGAA